MSRYAKAAEDYLVKLKTLAADRPAHAKYLADLVAAGEAGTELIDVPVPPGVSNRVAEALRDDMYWIESAAKFNGPGQLSVYSHAYRNRRQRDTRAVTERVKTQDSLGSLLGLGGGDE